MSTASTAVARRDGQDITAQAGALAVRRDQAFWDDKQRAALAVLGIKDATKADLAVFMHVCQRTGLDPFTKQIYGIMRREKQGDQWVTKFTIQVGIDGFRVIRDRAARRDGVEVEYEDTRWYDADGISYEIWLRPEPPAGCGMTILKNGKRYPAVLTYAEYCQKKDGKPIGLWRTAPAHQLEKCCEAFGLRRAFPHDLAGIRLDDEMPPADDAPPAVQRATAAHVVRQREPSQRRQGSGPAPAGQHAGQEADPTRAAAADGSEPTGGPADGQTARSAAQAASGQRSIIRGHFERLGYDDENGDREERLVFTGRLAGYPGDLATTRDLNEDQARRAIDHLKGVNDRAELVAAVTRIEQDERGEASDG